MTKYDPAEFFSAERRRPTMENDLIDRKYVLGGLRAARFLVTDQTGLDLMDRHINKAPAVDAVEVLHGRWVHGREIRRDYIGDVCIGVEYEDWRCSVCNCVVEKYLQPLWNYCPNCGAKMDGDS